MKSYWVEHSDPEFRIMLDNLEEHPLNKDVERDKWAAWNEGEKWTYLGTVEDKESGGFVHMFRHRRHPSTGKLEDITIPASKRGAV